MSLEFRDMPLRRCSSKAAARRQLIFGVRPEAIFTVRAGRKRQESR